MNGNDREEEEPGHVRVLEGELTPSLWGMVWGDSSPEERLKFMRIVFRLVVTVHILWAIGLFSSMGLPGFAWSKDVKNDMDEEHKKMLAPINAQLALISSDLNETKAIQKKILIGQIASQLRDLNRMRCRTTDETMRNKLEDDIETAQMSYRVLTGERYLLGSCKEL